MSGESPTIGDAESSKPDESFALVALGAEANDNTDTVDDDWTKMKPLKIIWRVFKIVVLQFIVTVGDIGTDLVSVCNFFNGGFAAMVYFYYFWILQVDSDLGLDTTNILFGLHTLALICCTGLLQIPGMAMEQNWKGTSWTVKLKMAGEHILLIFIWPVFSALL